MTLHDTTLHVAPDAFKRAMLFYAGQDFEDNKKAIRTKGNVSAAIMLFLVAEIGCFVAWIAAG